jgi:hypothetical protein
MDGRSRVSRGSVERHVAQSHPIMGTPWEVPVPRKVIRTPYGSRMMRFSPFWASRKRIRRS